LEGLDIFNIPLEKALEISKKTGVSLYPKLIYYWTQIKKENLLSLVEFLSKGVVKDKRIILPWTIKEQDSFEDGKRTLEILVVSHEVFLENIILENIESKKLLLNLGFDFDILNKEDFELKDLFDISKFDLDEEELRKDFEIKEENQGKDFNVVLEIVNKNSKFNIRDKAGDFIGARMGRPEKAKLRKLQGSPNVLFAVGSEGGRLRSIQSAVKLER
jgi:DNA polymerase II large subunit